MIPVSECYFQMAHFEKALWDFFQNCSENYGYPGWVIILPVVLFCSWVFLTSPLYRGLV